MNTIGLNYLEISIMFFFCLIDFISTRNVKLYKPGGDNDSACGKKLRLCKFMTAVCSSYQRHKKISSAAYMQLSLSMVALVGPLCGKRETHIHDISNTYVPFPQLFAKGK
jgi:hypothetical protein